MASNAILEMMAEKCREAGMTVDVADPGEGGIPSITVTTENGSMRVFHVPTYQCAFPDALVAQIESTPGIDMSALGEVYDGGAPFVPGEHFLIDLKSQGGEMPGISLIPWMRDLTRRGRAKRYDRYPPWRHRAHWKGGR